MKRIERVLDYIEKASAPFDLQKFEARCGMDAQEIADAMAMQRSNVSKELNELCREGKVVKFGRRPVLYFARDVLQGMYQLTDEFPSGALSFASLEDFHQALQEARGEVQKNPFDALIGAHRSLAHQVEQAKAAILYPPDGLHTLIVGQTGVGKTLFAHLMYAYGKAMGHFAEDAPFVTFNCADYYTNPQLLISHVFGHIKGAFTGAEQPRAGLVEEADGGVLFLDEIHRLPPEGQEMIFYFMDTGTFNRLGETTRSRHAKVLIIGATTEDPSSALTKTFVRRIPNIITIPPLSERTLSEKLDIIKALFMDEARRIKKPIRVTAEVVKALLGSIGAGNVGQLKSSIKLLCAKAFLNGWDAPGSIEIDFKMLPLALKNGLLNFTADRKAFDEFLPYLTQSLTVSPEGEKQVRGTVDEGEGDWHSFNLYRVVEEKVRQLKGEGIDSNTIKKMVAADVNLYIRELYEKRNAVNLSTRERLLKIVDAPLIDFSEKIVAFVQKKMKRVYHDRFLYAFCLHLSAFLKRVKNHETVPYPELSEAMEKGSKVYETAQEIRAKIEAQYHVQMPETETEYIALLLASAEDDDLDEKVIILVATHGPSTASSMVETAQKLFNTTETNLIPVDMPLDKKPQEIADQVITMLRGMPAQEGVLILADMGSLISLGDEIESKLHLPVRTLDMVSTPIVLEAMRKADIPGMTLDGIYDSLRSFRGYETAADTPLPETAGPDEKPEAVVTVCSTGRGAALKLKSLVEDALAPSGKKIEVVPLGLTRLEEHLAELAGSRRVVAAVGMKQPKSAVPFISLEQFIDGSGEQELLHLVGAVPLAQTQKSQKQGKRVVRSLCEDSLRRFLTYLNPEKILDTLMLFEQDVEHALGRTFSNPVRIRLIVHCGCALERCVTRSPLDFSGDREEIDTQKYKAIQNAAKRFEASLNLRLDADEMALMSQMI